MIYPQVRAGRLALRGVLHGTTLCGAATLARDQAARGIVGELTLTLAPPPTHIGMRRLWGRAGE